MKALIVLTVLSLITLVSEILNFKKLLFPIVLIGLAVALGADILDWNTGYRYYNDMMYFDNYAAAFTGLLIVITFLWMLHSHYYLKNRTETISDKYALVLFALIGGLVLASFSHMVMLFLGIEILSIPLYILAGSRKADGASNESAMKYFLMGAFASSFLLLGITLVYGATGSFHLQNIATFLANTDDVPSFLYVGIVLMLVGMAFKISAVPFHFWTPDVYQGAPTVFTTFMATLVKTAAMAAFFRLFATAFISLNELWINIIGVIAVLTILVGNITAVYQDSVKRMLAYSSVAHAGYMLLALLAINNMSASAILLYAAAYSLSTIIAFSVLFLVMESTASESFDSFNGLAKRSPLLAVATVISMLSLAGIPPTAGFFAKYYIFSTALESNYIVPVLIAVLGSLIGVYYYFKVIIALFRPATFTQEDVKPGLAFTTIIILCSILVLALGLFPNLIIDLI
jgi:NADH-quinone oxidoreductase subunit N